MTFILSLKGYQFISGLVKACTLSFGMWQCIVTGAAGECHVSAPGVGSDVPSAAALLLWLQCLQWGCFLMLPYAHRFNRVTGRLEMHHADAAWETNRARAVAEAAEARYRLERGG
eukprot:7343419-Prymnesium_polylepis.2